MKALSLALAALVLIAAGDPRTETDHVVERGETLKTIARTTGVPVVVIAEANGLAEDAKVRRGQTLVIPRQQSHTVKRGETSFAIAYQYGVPWEQIATANNLDGDARLRPGQKLIIPALLPERNASASAVRRDARASAPALPPLFRRPVEGDVLLGFQRRSNGSGHEGIDFATEEGDRVRAAAAGTVIFAGEEPTRFGRLVVVDHGEGWHTAYGNLSKVTVKAGQRIKAGERIGLAGHTGDATRPELHFEVRQADKPVDPAPLLGLTR